jgi:hypothetical protein
MVVLCGMALALPLAAQEDTVPTEPPPAETKAESSDTAPTKKGIDDPPLHKWGGWTLSVAGWDPSLVGADEEVAAIQTGSIFQPPLVFQPVVQGGEAAIEETVSIAYHLPNGFGSIVAQYDGMSQDDLLQNFTPGQFHFAETRAYPILLGAFDDGLADGVASDASRTTREFRLDYQNQAFASKWARGTWGVGYRQLSHQRGLGITYYAIVPNFPPAIPPVVGGNTDPLRLAPLPDAVTQTSDFSGHGLGVSLDVEFPLHPRVSIITGLSIGLIRGKTDSAYTSTSSYYYLNGTPDDPLTTDELFALLSNPPPPTSPPDPPAPTVADIEQGSVVVVLNQPSASQLAQSYDIYIGVEVTVARGVKIFGTLRDVSYTNVGEYVVPKPGPANETTSLNAGYEGYTIGLSWRF